MKTHYQDPRYQANRKQILAGNPDCALCGKPGADTADHIIALMNGGTHDLDNLQPAHRTCNSRKGNADQTQAAKARRQRRETTTTTSFFQDEPLTPTQLDSLSFRGELAGTGGDWNDSPGVGRELPRLETASRGVGSYGPQVGEWAKRFLGVELMPWQIRALSGQLLHDEEGRLVHHSSLVSTARQNGKSVALQALIGWWITQYASIVGKPQAVLSVANKLDRAEAIFTGLMPALREYFDAKPSQVVGRKGVKMPDGSVWEVRAATVTQHGGSYDLVVIDECWDVDERVINEALRPTQIARPNPLFSAWSTAGDQDSTWMIDTREACLRDIDLGKNEGTYFAEWSIPPSVDPRDESYWGWASPALGTTITLKALRANSKKDYFLRAHLNQWVAAKGAWLTAAEWGDNKSGDDMPDGGWLAVDSSVDEARYVGVRAAMIGDGVMVTTEFVVHTEAEMWGEIERVMKDPKVMLALTPTLEIHVPISMARRYQTVGYGELLKFTSLVRNMILEGKVLHRGDSNLADHVCRATMVKTAQGAVLSSQRSPGPIELARTMVWATSLVSKPGSRQKPMLVVSG